MSKWRITLKEEDVSDQDWKAVRSILKTMKIKFEEYRVI